MRFWMHNTRVPRYKKNEFSEDCLPKIICPRKKSVRCTTAKTDYNSTSSMMHFTELSGKKLMKTDKLLQSGGKWFATFCLRMQNGKQVVACGPVFK